MRLLLGQIFACAGEVVWRRFRSQAGRVLDQCWTVEGLAATDTLHVPQMRCGRNQSENLSAAIEPLMCNIVHM